MGNSAVKPSFAKKIFRIVKVLTIALSILIIAATALFYFKKDRIAEQLLSFFNTVQNGEIKIKDLAFSPFKHFPDISIRLDDVEYYESKSDSGQNPFAKIDHLYASIDIVKAINGEIYISEVTLEGGFVFLQINNDYNLNIIQALGIAPSKVATDTLLNDPLNISTPGDQSPVSLELQNIYIKNVEFKLESNPADFVISLKIKELKSDLQYNQPKTEIQASLDFEVYNLGFYNRSYLKGKDFSLQTYFSYNDKNDQIQVKNGELKYMDILFDLDGTYDVYKDGWIDLSVDGSDNDMTLLALVIDEDILKINPDILNEGNLFFSAKIEGKTIRGYPNFSVDFGAEKIEIQLPDGTGQIKDFGFKGTFNSDTLPDLSNAFLEINELNASMSDSWNIWGFCY